MTQQKLVLIDYQNIQNLAGLRQLGKSIVCEVFLGVNQKLSGEQLHEFEFATTRWNLVKQQGKNAADMLIVLKLGQLLDDFNEIYIVSKDRDFDSIVAFVSAKPNKLIKRIENFAKTNFHVSSKAVKK